MTTEQLFDGYEPEPEFDLSGLSADQRRTRRQRLLIEQGINPATKRPLAETGETCGSCGHCWRVGWRSKAFFKCGLVDPTHGPGTDIRKWWPACDRWAPSPDSTVGATIEELLKDATQ